MIGDALNIDQSIISRVLSNFMQMSNFAQMHKSSDFSPEIKSDENGDEYKIKNIGLKAKFRLGELIEKLKPKPKESDTPDSSTGGRFRGSEKKLPVGISHKTSHNMQVLFLFSIIDDFSQNRKFDVIYPCSIDDKNIFSLMTNRFIT